MKKVIVIACLIVVLTMVVAMAASAATSTTQDGWRLYFKAADTAGLNSTGDSTMGVGSSSKDGFGVDTTVSDSVDVRTPLGTQTSAQRTVVGVFNNLAWKNDMKSNRLPTDPAYAAGATRDAAPLVTYGAYPYEAGRKIWDLRVVGLGTASTVNTLLTIRFVSVVAGLPKTELPVYGVTPLALVPATYSLRMVDNQGKEGAPANGTVWSIPVPATWQTAAFFSLTLPTVNITVPKDEASILSQGYKMQFYQETAVPEPSSLLSLGAGLMGLAGFVSRKRRS